MLQTVETTKARAHLVRQVADWIKENKSEGDTVTHAELLPMLRESERGLPYYNMVGRVKRRVLQDCGIAMRNRTNEGYDLCRGHEQIDTGTKVIKGGVKRMMRGLNVVGMIEDGRLSESDRKTRDYILGNGRTMIEMSKAEVKQFRLLVGKPTVMPNSNGRA